MILDSRESRVHPLSLSLQAERVVDSLAALHKGARSCVMARLVIVILNTDHLVGLSLLQLGDQLLDQIVSLFDQLLIRHVQLVLVEKILCMVPTLRQLAELALERGQLRALTGDDLPQVEDVLGRVLVLELLNKVFELADALHELLSVEDGSLGGVVTH